jgi:hypothetical protein
MARRDRRGLQMPKVLPLCLLCPVIPCSWDLGSRKINTLVLITLCLGCAREACEPLPG